jgi:hypothetical protein
MFCFVKFIDIVIFVLEEFFLYIFQENEVLDKENHNLTEQLLKSEETRVQLQKELESLARLQQHVCIFSVPVLLSDIFSFLSKINLL